FFSKSAGCSERPINDPNVLSGLLRESIGLLIVLSISGADSANVTAHPAPGIAKPNSFPAPLPKNFLGILFTIPLPNPLALLSILEIISPLPLDAILKISSLALVVIPLIPPNIPFFLVIPLISSFLNRLNNLPLGSLKKSVTLPNPVDNSPPADDNALGRKALPLLNNPLILPTGSLTNEPNPLAIFLGLNADTPRFNRLPKPPIFLNLPITELGSILGRNLANAKAPPPNSSPLPKVPSSPDPSSSLLLAINLAIAPPASNVNTVTLLLPKSKNLSTSFLDSLSF